MKFPAAAGAAFGPALAILSCLAVSRANAEEIKVGFVLSTFQEERYQKDKKFFADEARRLGLMPIMVSAENNPQTQLSKVTSLIDMGVKVLVIQPVNAKAANLVTLAHEHRIPVIAYDRMIEAAPVDYYVTQDSLRAGALQAEAAVKATGGKGNFVLLLGQEGHSVATEMVRGIKSVLSKSPAIKVIVEKSHEGWSQSAAKLTVENALLQFDGKVAAILANNSEMAQGAVKALQEHKLAGKVFVAGADADSAAINSIVRGNQQFEVLKEIEPLAKAAALAASQLARGEKPKASSSMKNGKFDVPYSALPVVGIDKANVQEKIFNAGVLKMGSADSASTAPAAGSPTSGSAAGSPQPLR